MEHFNNFTSPRRNLWILLLCLMLARVVHSQYDDVPAPPVLPGVGNTAGSGGSLFCISDCETCPVICSPSTPPSPPTTKPTTTPPSTSPPALPILFPPPSTAPPPEVHHHRHSPPTPLPPQLPYYFPSPTPESSLPYYNSPPSGGVAEKSAPPPPPPPPPPSPPSPSFVSWGGDGTLPLPPPSSGYMPSIQTPNGMNQRNYSYPYYYYYASNASSSSSFAHLKGSSFAITLFLLLSILV